jgi:peptide/nickel transport system permease protein
MFLTLWVVVTLTFILMHSIPGDPFSENSDQISEQVLENMRAKYNLDKPLHIQYVYYLKSLGQLDLGSSIKSETRTVSSIISSGISASAILGLQAILIAIFFGLIFGTIAALNRNRWSDHLAMTLAVVGVAIPSFIVAPILINIFAIKIPIFPVATWGTWMHSVLPSVALALSPLAIITRFFRTSMIDVMNENFIRTVEAKGFPRYLIVIKHAIRNAILPIVTFIGPLTANLLTGTFVVERIFAIPGMGKYFVDSIFNRDYPVIMGMTIFYSAVLVIILFLVDLAYTAIDPRIRLHKNRGNV